MYTVFITHPFNPNTWILISPFRSQMSQQGENARNRSLSINFKWPRLLNLPVSDRNRRFKIEFRSTFRKIVICLPASVCSLRNVYILHQDTLRTHHGGCIYSTTVGCWESRQAKLKPCMDKENTLYNRPVSVPKPDTQAMTRYLPCLRSHQEPATSNTFSCTNIYSGNLKKKKQIVVNKSCQNFLHSMH